LITKEQFEQTYSNIIKNSKADLEKTRKRLRKPRITFYTLTLILFIFVGCLFLIDNIVGTVAIALLIFLVGISIIVIDVYERSSSYKEKKEKYVELYKDIVIKPLLSCFSENFVFDLKDCLSQEEYNNAGFESYQYYSSDGLISGKIADKYDISISEVNVIGVVPGDADNPSDASVTKFKGVFTKMKLDKNTDSIISIRRNPLNVLIGGKYNKYTEGFDFNSQLPNSLEEFNSTNKDFNKYFKVLSNNETLTGEILSSELMDTFVRMFKQINFEINIINEYVYLRIAVNKNLFEPDFNKSIIQKDKLQELCDLLNFIITLLIDLVNSL